MKHVNLPIAESRERLPALALAMVVTALVFAAINAGFTPHASALTESGVATQMQQA